MLGQNHGQRELRYRIRSTPCNSTISQTPFFVFSAQSGYFLPSLSSQLPGANPIRPMALLLGENRPPQPKRAQSSSRTIMERPAKRMAPFAPLVIASMVFVVNPRATVYAWDALKSSTKPKTASAFLFAITQLLPPQKKTIVVLTQTMSAGPPDIAVAILQKAAQTKAYAL